MIDTSKQYTYNGKPVRIYADGSDTVGNLIHCSYFMNNEWQLFAVNESDLEKAWGPKEGELVYLWDDKSDYCLIGKYANSPYGHTFRLSNNDTGKSYKYCAPFTGTLPEAFKGLV